MPSPRAARTNAEWSALTRSALLQAAREAFASEGYESASLDAIAAAASATKGSIYHHYHDKRELFRAVFEDVQRTIVEHVDRAARSAQTPLDAIQRGCEAFLEVVSKGGIARIVLTDGPSVLGWTTWRAIDDDIGGESLRTGLKAAMDAGAMARVDVRALATLISGALNEGALTIAESDDPQRTRRALVKVLRRMFDGLRAR